MLMIFVKCNCKLNAFHASESETLESSYLSCIVTSRVLQVLSNADMGYGYNAAKDCYEDLMKAGIMDPSKVHFFLINSFKRRVH